MTARVNQGFLQGLVKVQSGEIRAQQGFLQVIASIEPPFANARVNQAFVQVLTRTYKISKPAEPGQATVRVGVHNGFALLTMGSMNED